GERSTGASSSGRLSVAELPAIPTSFRSRGSGQHGENGLDLVRGRSQQRVVAGLALCGSLQNDLGHVCFEPRRDLIDGNFGHHLVEDRPHGLDEFWTVARHDAPSCFAPTGLLTHPTPLVPANAGTQMGITE